MEMKLAEKLALIRSEAEALVPVPAEAVQYGSGKYLVKTETGYCRVTFTAVKADEDFDPEELREEWLADVAVKEAAKQARLAKKEADKKADLAKKARAKAEKES